MATALEVVRGWQARLRAHDFGDMSDVVDVAGYTEICVGLTPWTVGYAVALDNYVKNMVQPWADLEAREDQVVAGPDGVFIRSHVTATHTGEFLGIPATGRRVEWDAVTMVQVNDGRVVGQWAQHRRLRRAGPERVFSRLVPEGSLAPAPPRSRASALAYARRIQAEEAVLARDPEKPTAPTMRCLVPRAYGVASGPPIARGDGSVGFHQRVAGSCLGSCASGGY